ncbi:hypothetical protein D3Z48_18155 [Clostridiaceae bacterium]|nr:hypothetical protein [Clostridiaceae bacterium]
MAGKVLRQSGLGLLPKNWQKVAGRSGAGRGSWPSGLSPFCRRQQTIATDHSRRVLDGLTAQTAATAPAQGAGTAGRGNTQPAAKTAHTAQEGGADGSAAQE